MGVNVLVVVQIPEQYDNCEVNTWRRDLLNAFNPDDFYSDGPLVGLTPTHLAGPFPLEQTWINVNLLLKQGRGDFRRCDGQYITQIIEWLIAHIPGARIWVGNDACDTLRPFGEDGTMIEYWG